MERTFGHLLTKAVKAKVRHENLRELVSQRDKLNEQINVLRIEEQADTFISTVEDAEIIIKLFIKNKPDVRLTIDSQLDSILSEEEQEELIEKINDFYGITLPEDFVFTTFGELVLQMEELK